MTFFCHNKKQISVEQQGAEVNRSTPEPKGRGLLEVDAESHLSTPPSKASLRAAERMED
jgi:hypothetical protein